MYIAPPCTAEEWHNLAPGQEGSVVQLALFRTMRAVAGVGRRGRGTEATGFGTEGGKVESGLISCFGLSFDWM